MKFQVGQMVEFMGPTVTVLPAITARGTEILDSVDASANHLDKFVETNCIIMDCYESDVVFESNNISSSGKNEKWNTYKVYLQNAAQYIILFECELKEIE